VGAGELRAYVEAIARDLMEDMATATTLFIVNAVTQAVQDGESCNLNLVLCADAGECARTNRLCRGSGIDGVIPCCADADLCIRRTETESRCRRRSAPVPGSWLGGEDRATVCPEGVSMEL